MSNELIKEVSTQSISVIANKVDKFVDVFTELYPGVHPLDRLWVPFKDQPNDINDIKIILISFKSTSHFKKHDVASLFKLDIEPALERERDLLRENLDTFTHEITFIMSFVTSYKDQELSALLKKLGFKYDRKHLHIIILATPEEINNSAFHRERIILDEFESDKSGLTSEHKIKLKIVAEYVKDTWRKYHPAERFKPVHEIRIIGHTDSVGTEEYNMKLGTKRAKSVYDYINPKIKRRLNKIKIHPVASGGEGNPRVITDDPNGKNRGVLIFVTYYENPINSLTRIKESILRLLEKNKNELNDTFYREAKCIAEKLADISYEDRFYKTVPAHDKFSYHLLFSLRLILLRYKYNNKSDKYIYDQYKSIIDEIKHAIRHANSKKQGPTGLLVPDPPNVAKRKDFAFQRILKNNPPSILQCLALKNQ